MSNQGVPTFGNTATAIIYKDINDGVTKISMGHSLLNGINVDDNYIKHLIMPGSNTMILITGNMNFGQLWCETMKKNFELCQGTTDALFEHMKQIAHMAVDTMSARQMLKAIETVFKTIPMPNPDLCNFEALVGGWENGAPFLASVGTREGLVFGDQSIGVVGSGRNYAMSVLQKEMIKKKGCFSRDDAILLNQAALTHASNKCANTGGKAYVFCCERPSSDWYEHARVEDFDVLNRKFKSYPHYFEI